MDYLLLHSSGRSDTDTADLDLEVNEATSIGERTNNTVVLVKETPISMLINIAVEGQDLDRSSSSEISHVSESQSRSPKMVDNIEHSLLVEINEAELAQRREQVEQEWLENEKRAKLLMEQIQMEAQE